MIYYPASFQRRDVEVLSPISEESLGPRGFRGMGLQSASSQTWVANLAVFVPFGISRPFLVREVWWFNGSAAGNNVDVGVYATDGTLLFSLGSTASGANSAVITSSGMTDYTLAAGDYYMAFACSGTTNDVGAWAPAANIAAGLGVGEMASAMALPSSATIVPLTNALLPYFGLNGNSVAV